MYDFSIVIPVYNGAQTIERLIETVEQELSDYHFEIILVNDGSKDQSAKICQGLSEKIPHLTFVNLRKNFGEFNAVMCGLHFVSGKYAAIIDDDFQNPPSEILKLYQKAL